MCKDLSNEFGRADDILVAVYDTDYEILTYPQTHNRDMPQRNFKTK